MDEIKIYSFKNDNGEDFIAAAYPREAIKYYFDYYMDDLNIGDMVENGGIMIRELTMKEVRQPLEETTNLDDSTKEYSLMDILKEYLSKQKNAEKPIHLVKTKAPIIPTWVYKRKY